MTTTNPTDHLAAIDDTFWMVNTEKATPSMPHGVPIAAVDSFDARAVQRFTHDYPHLVIMRRWW